MKISLLLLFFQFSSVVFSQPLSKKELKIHQQDIAESKKQGSVVLSFDTIYDKGIAYAVLKENHGLLMTDYTLYSLTGKELIFIHYECTEGVILISKKCYHSFTFMESGNRAEVEHYIGIDISSLIVDNNLIKDNDIDSVREKKFIMKYPPKFSKNAPQPGH